MKWQSVNIPGFEHYVISECGDLVNTRTMKKISGWYNSSGYHRVRLCSNNKKTEQYTHRLVLMTFRPPEWLHKKTSLGFDDVPEDAKTEVHHIDNNRANNCLANLEWCTRKENMEYVWDRKRKQFDEVHTPAPAEHEPEREAVEKWETNDDDLPF